MDEAAFLDYHNNGIGKLLGIRIASGSRERVVAEVAVDRGRMTAPDVVHGGVLMALADAAAAYGAVLNMPPGCTTATIESKTNFLRRGSGSTVRAEAVPIRVGRTLSVWRTQLHRGEGGAIAETTQTQIYHAETVATPAQGERNASADKGAEGSAAVAESESSPVRERRGTVVDARKRQIFTAACEVIARKGFAAASIREIAMAAEMPVPTMYQYIESKGDLLFVIYQYFMEDLGSGLRAAVSPERRPIENLEAAIRSLIRKTGQHEQYIRLMFHETKSLPREMRGKVFDLDAQNIAMLVDLLEATREAGEADFEDALITANAIYFLCVLWPLRHWAMAGRDREDVGEHVFALLRKALKHPAMLARMAENV